MSRIGKQPIVLPEGVTAECDRQAVVVRGPLGELRYTVHPAVKVTVEPGRIVCAVKRLGKGSSAQWGTTRARLKNMVAGVRDGFRRELELHGVGYRAQLDGKALVLSVGYSHPVMVEAPEGIRFGVLKDVISVEGIDLVLVGQVAANIRAVRKPEPYKGKGIRMRGEAVRRKVGKVAGSAE